MVHLISCLDIITIYSIFFTYFHNIYIYNVLLRILCNTKRISLNRGNEHRTVGGILFIAGVVGAGEDVVGSPVVSVNARNHYDHRRL